MASNLNIFEAWGRIALNPNHFAGTATNIALNSAYTYGSTGSCWGFPICPEDTTTMTDFWIYVASYSGTWGSTDGVINVEIRDGLNGSHKAGSSIITGGSFTITLDGSTTGWIKKSGLSISLTKNGLYFVSIADADGGATNYVTLQRASSHSIYALTPTQASTSTNGWSTGSNGGNYPTGAYKIGGKILCANPPLTHSTVTSNTLERGVKFQVPDRCELVGIRTGDQDQWSTAATIKLYADGTNPGGSALLTSTIPTQTLGGGTSPLNWVNFLGAANRYVLTPGNWYRLVMLPGASSTTPRKITFNGSPDSDLLNTIRPFGGNYYYTVESGGAWSDDTSAVSYLSPLLIPATSPTIVS